MIGFFMIKGRSDLHELEYFYKEPFEIVDVADRALEILKPIENWPGITRAYAARATAHEKTG